MRKKEVNMNKNGDKTQKILRIKCPENTATNFFSNIYIFKELGSSK
jgi:hypothetical protein